MITSYSDEENHKIAKDLGADDFLTKPVDFTRLKEKLNLNNWAVDACLAVRAKIGIMPSLKQHVTFIPNVSKGYESNWKELGHINSGEMISEKIESVTLKRLDYSVIGDVVNTA